MPGIFGDIAEFFTGDKAREAEKQQGRDRASLAQTNQQVQGQVNQINQTAGQFGQQAGQANQLAQGYNQGAQQSMGANAADYMRRANQAAQGQAEQEATAAARQGSRASLQAARTAGVNRGQAAMQAGQQAGNVYGQSYQGALGAGRNQYMQGTQQFAQQGAQQQGLAQGALQGQVSAQNAALGGLGQNQQSQQAMFGQSTTQYNQGRNQAGAGGGAIEGVVNAAFSDQNLKENIRPSSGRLAELLAKVRPVEFNYTGEAGQDPTKERLGVLAQDLEKTSMADNVIDTPEGKMVDTAQQTLSNTALIAEMAQELYDLKRKMREMGVR